MDEAIRCSRCGEWCNAFDMCENIYCDTPRRCWYCGDEDCSGHSETELRHAAED